MATKEDGADSKPAPRSKRLSVIAGELTKEAAVDASPGKSDNFYEIKGNSVDFLKLFRVLMLRVQN